MVNVALIVGPTPDETDLVRNFKLAGQVTVNADGMAFAESAEGDWEDHNA